MTSFYTALCSFCNYTKYTSYLSLSVSTLCTLLIVHTTDWPYFGAESFFFFFFTTHSISYTHYWIVAKLW